MTIISEKNLIEDLAFSLSAMLGVTESENLMVDPVPGPTTSVTLRVQSQEPSDLKAFVKTVKNGHTSGLHLRLGIREVRFYQFMDALDLDPYPNIPRCLNSYVSTDEKSYFLVLEDLSDSHQDYQLMDFSKIESWKFGLSALAKFYRNFTHKLSKEQIQLVADDEHNIEAYLKKLEDAYRKFKADNSDYVSFPFFELMESCIPVIR